MSGTRRIGVRPGIAACHLGSPAALIEIIGSLLFGGVADLDVVIYRDRAAGLRHSRGGALVLITLLLPSMVATPPCTWTWNFSTLIFGRENFARMVASISASDFMAGLAGALAV
jgi:hypothetical protein